MKYVNHITIVLVLLSTSISCRKSYLDVENNSLILREQYVKDLTSLQQYLNGIYVWLARECYSGGRGHQIYADLIADNIKPTSRNTSTFIPHYLWNQSTGTSSSGTHMDALWQSIYHLIRSCSFAIDKADELKEESITKANQIQGEAYSLRALAHFVLVNVFAQSYNFSPNGSHPGVPYITSWDWNDPFSRNTVKEVYDGMISDLQAAISLFPSNTINKITMNQYAAKALLARVYLFKEDWQRSKTLAIEVANAVPLLPSVSYPSKLFTPEETEALFQLAPSSENLIANSYTTSFQGVQFRSTNFLATKDIANLLTQNPNDNRRKWISSAGIGKDSIRKYPVDIVPGFGSGTNPNRSYYQTLLRTSEMFLTVAEAAAKTGDENTARTYLDVIRQRANPTVLISTATGTALLDSIYLERRKELAFEGLRMWDLLRWKQGVNRTDVATGAPTILPYPSSKAIAPIPQKDAAYGINQNIDY